MNAIHPPLEPWQLSLRQLITDPDELIKLIELDTSWLEPAHKAAKLFPLRVTREFARRIGKGDPDDPLLKQVLPLDLEHREIPGYTTDPLEESAARPVPGVVHKYRDRILLITSGACAINCRYCFRRHFPYEDNQLSGKQLDQALSYIESRSEIHEVILSGGDPLTTSDKRLASLIERLETLPQLKRLRIHTRLPVVLPSRITQRLTELLSQTRLNSVLVTHINHADEIDQEVTQALLTLRQAGVHLLNQAVFLKGINDSVETQVRLSRTLFEVGVLPYYLFMFDPVAGASHFDIGPDRARALYRQMQTELPGYLTPRLAQEIPGRPSKTLILPEAPST